MRLLLDPRRPLVYKEGLTCEEPTMLQHFTKQLLGMKAVKPKGLERRAEADLQSSGQNPPSQ